MINFFKRIKPLDITLIQIDWKGPEFTHTWLATYYGEPIGLIYFSENTWKIYGKCIKKKKYYYLRNMKMLNIGSEQMIFYSMR